MCVHTHSCRILDLHYEYRSGWKQAEIMFYKTRTYINEAVIVRSTGCDIDDIWPMYAVLSKSWLARRQVI